MKKLSSSWKSLKENFKLTEVIGEGSGGIVVKALHRESKKLVAIKMIDCTFNDLNHMKYVLRELSILRQIGKNDFTVNLLDCVIPDHAFSDLYNLKNLFFVMDLVPNDLN